MVQPKLIQALILFLFISVVILGIFFLLRRQLTPLMNEVVMETSTTPGASVVAPSQPPTPTATMPALTLDMLATVQPTATPIAETTTPTPSGPVDPNARVGIVTGDAVNIRSYPSMASEVIGEAKQGERLEIILISNDGQWVQVCCPLGTDGSYRQSWVAAEFIDIQSPVTQGVATGVTTSATAGVTSVNVINTVRPGSNAIIGTVNGTLVNIRRGPDTAYEIVGQVSEHTQVEITGRNEAGTWWQICCPPGAPTDSWISADLTDLSIAKEQAIERIPIASAPAITSTNLTDGTN